MSKDVALVLSSGGARGLAHIGVIEGLESEGYRIRSVAGSSMGALVGAFYCCGALDVYKKWALDLERFDVFKLFDFTFSTQGFIRGERVFKELQKVIPDKDINDMSIPFSAVATDARNRKEVVFTSGSMYQSLRASTAVPTVLKPLYLEDMELIDGGVSNPIPVEHVARHPGDILVVSNVNASKPFVKVVEDRNKEIQAQQSYDRKINEFFNKWSRLLPGTSEAQKKLGFFDLLNRSIDLMQDKLTSVILEQYKPDILVEISAEACGTFEFYQAEDLIRLGRQEFQEAIYRK